MNRDISTAIFEASKKRIPGGVNSPVRSFPGLDMTLLIAAKGQGAYVWDADGHRYIDYCGSWGPLIAGHCHPDVVKAAADQLRQGSTFGWQHRTKSSSLQKFARTSLPLKKSVLSHPARKLR